MENPMRGILLAGGTGSRLWPSTLGVSKQLLPVFDKPMIYYPLSMLMLSGVREILVISTPRDLPVFRRVLGDGSGFGCRLSFAEQARPEGLAQAFLIAEDYIGDNPCALILGDNLFYGGGMNAAVKNAARRAAGGGAVIFACKVKDPTRYGVVEFDESGKALGIEEKPAYPKSDYAVPGLYFYGSGVCEKAGRVRPSARGELEITDLHRIYLEQGELLVTPLGRGIAWLDTGTPQSLLDASAFIQAIQERQGLMVACLEEIGFDNGWLDLEGLERAARRFAGSDYGAYLAELLKRETHGATII